MRKDINSIQKKLQGVSNKDVSAIKVKEPAVQKNKLHLIMLATEDRYKVESVLFYSSPTGSEHAVEYEKKYIQESLLEDINVMKNFIGYIFFLKQDGSVVPIKEFIITNVTDMDDRLSITFMIGEYETNEVRRSKKLSMGNNNDKLIFLANI